MSDILAHSARSGVSEEPRQGQTDAAALFVKESALSLQIGDKRRDHTLAPVLRDTERIVSDGRRVQGEHAAPRRHSTPRQTRTETSEVQTRQKARQALQQDRPSGSPESKATAENLPIREEKEEAAKAARPNVFWKQGEMWEISFADKTVYLKGSVGLQYIHRLLENQGERITLPGDVERQEMEPHRARGDAEERLESLNTLRTDTIAKLEQAKTHNDEAAQIRHADDMKSINSEINKAVGIGGRARRTGSPEEQGRVRHGKAVAEAMKKIERVHPMLHRHLKEAILHPSGQTPGYVPKEPLVWVLR